MKTAALGLGARVRAWTKTFVLVGLQPPAVWLRDSLLELTTVSVTELLRAPDFAVLEPGRDEPRRQVQSLFQTVDPTLREDAETLIGHLNEVRFGYRSEEDRQNPDVRPRPEYDPARPEAKTQEKRIAHKCAELGCSRAFLFEKLRILRDMGPIGLIPASALAPVTRGEQFEPRVEALVAELLADVVSGSKSKPRDTDLHRRLEAMIDDYNAHLEADEQPIKKVPYSTFVAKLAIYTHASGYRRRTTKSLRGTASRPPTPYRHFRARRPGEYVLIDSSPYDVWALHSETGEPIRLMLTIALDLYSRSIVAFRLTPRDAGAIDTAMLIYDIVSPNALLHRVADGVEPDVEAIPSTSFEQPAA